MDNPLIIQGGMGTGVSNWRLARSVARLGHMGVVSGAAMDVVISRRLQLGDIGGHLRRAFDLFPFPEIADRVWKQYFIEGGKRANETFQAIPMHSPRSSQALTELTVLANFCEVTLAKEGHNGPVGINYLETVQLPTLPSIYGAMLAGVTCILMGAGIPRAIPGILDDLAAGKPVSLKLNVLNSGPNDNHVVTFDPKSIFHNPPANLPRPKFFAIVSSATLATSLARKSTGKVDGFIVEGATAGGHNAPPRGPMQLSASGEPVYGERDVPDLDKIRNLGIPFWLAGSYGRPGKLAEALALGASGIQVGSAFAFCEESGLNPELKSNVLQLSQQGKLKVLTHPSASPTGFPFKIVQLEGTLSSESAYVERERICNLGFLRQAYQKPDGSLGFRCSAEPVEIFERKGGACDDSEGRRCLCNCLLANVDLGQVYSNGEMELPLLTAGDDAASLYKFLKPGAQSYSAADVIEKLLSPA